MAQHSTETGVGNWFFSGVQKHEKTQLIERLQRDFPDEAEGAVEQALVSACSEVKISEGREKLEDAIRAKLG